MSHSSTLTRTSMRMRGMVATFRTKSRMRALTSKRSIHSSSIRFWTTSSIACPAAPLTSQLHSRHAHVRRFRESDDRSPRMLSTTLDHTTTHNNNKNNSNEHDTTNSKEPPQVRLEHFSNNENVPGGIVSVLTLNRPKAANAMSRLMRQQLDQAVSELNESTSRCVILASQHATVFSAGADLKERQTMTPKQAELFVADLRQTLERVHQLPMPVIAAVAGTALGGGLELALAADLRVTRPETVLGLVETSLAIVPGAGGTQRLPRLVGVSKAKELIFTAQKITGQEAFHMGLVDHVVTEETENDSFGASSLPPPSSSPSFSCPVMNKAWDLAWQIASNGPIAVRAAKQAIDQGMFATTMQEALNVERECYGRVLNTNDRLEGLAAFAEKRHPFYRGD